VVIRSTRPELLAPAGNLEKLRVAVLYGADAVYLGGEAFSLRAFAGNFNVAEMQEGVAFAHRRGVKVYAAVNIFPRNPDLEALPGFLEEVRDAGIDALIVSDPGVIRTARRVAPELPLHLSTQANNVNWAGALFWQEQDLRRLVLARELSLAEIREIRNRVELELEVFVHGAMCVSYSGRCLLSNYLVFRDSNQGECAHPCRWKYHLMEETRPGRYFPVFEDDWGAYILNSHDLCLIEHLPQLIEAGIDSFKIEGRMKSVHYVATGVKVYRQAITAYLADREHYRFNRGWLEELAKVSHRDYTSGFLCSRPDWEDHSYLSTHNGQTCEFIGIVRQYDGNTGEAEIEQRNHFAVGEKVEVFGPKTDPVTFVIPAMHSGEGERITKAPHPHQLVRVPVPVPVEEQSLVRRVQ
jgi:putative protease